MSDLTLVLLAAGEASRFKKPVKKQWLRIGEEPLWLHTLKKFRAMHLFKHFVVVGHAEEIIFMQRHIYNEKIRFVVGGASRQASLQNALDHIKSPLVLVSDVARPCVNKQICQTLLTAIETSDCAVPTLPIPDTVYYQGEPIDRQHLLRIQTPQLSRTETLRQALGQTDTFSDESSAIHALGKKVAFIAGDASLHKLTFAEDVAILPCLQPPDTQTRRVGVGFDVHAFKEEGTMMLCGVEVSKEMGFQAHSDGDVAIHALIDALLGAAGIGDIGELFPDTHSQWAGADSAKLLRHVVHLLWHTGFEIENVDLTIIAQMPKISPHKERMRKRLSEILELTPYAINIKASTTEKLGFVGRQEGVAVQASATLKLFDWTRK